MFATRLDNETDADIPSHCYLWSPKPLLPGLSEPRDCTEGKKGLASSGGGSGKASVLLRAVARPILRRKPLWQQFLDFAHQR
jgi:hypothetical protein